MGGAFYGLNGCGIYDLNGWGIYGSNGWGGASGVGAPPLDIQQSLGTRLHLHILMN